MTTTTKSASWTIYEDNAGGLHLYHWTAGALDYLHTYDSPEQIAEDVAVMCKGENPAEDWDGNELEERIAAAILHDDTGYTEDDLDNPDVRKEAVEAVENEMQQYVDAGNGSAKVILTGTGDTIDDESVIDDPSGCACRKFYAVLDELDLIHTDTAPSYTITADHEHGDPDYHCATLTVGDMTWSHTVGDFDLGPNTLTYRQAIAAEIIDDPDDVDEDDLDDVISDRGAFAASVREEIETAALRASDDYADAEIAAKADEATEDIDEYAKFLWWSPRGFANECSLYGVRADEVDSVEKWLDDADPAQSKWEWMDADAAKEELREGIDNAVNLARGFGADNPPCGVTGITPWSEAHA